MPTGIGTPMELAKQFSDDNLPIHRPEYQGPYLLHRKERKTMGLIELVLVALIFGQGVGE